MGRVISPEHLCGCFGVFLPPDSEVRLDDEVRSRYCNKDVYTWTEENPSVKEQQEQSCSLQAGEQGAEGDTMAGSTGASPAGPQPCSI